MNPVDLLLAAILVTVGAAVLTARALRTAVIFFIVFGLLVALVWVRLGAPDLALAEVAIGAGVSGALLLESSAKLEVGPRPARLGAVVLAGAASGVLAAMLLLAALVHDSPDAAATRLAGERLGETEVSHPVTAVLLAYRAYDTLLEIAVLLAAVIAVLALREAGVTPVPAQQDPVLRSIAAATLPVAVLVAAYLLWAGATRTGGAFQAGATLAGVILLARFAGLGSVIPAAENHAVLWAGLAVFVTVGIAGAAAAGAVLAYPPGWGAGLILAVESALAISIASSLVALFGKTPG